MFTKFSASIENDLENLRLDLSYLVPDHACFRVGTLNEYEVLRDNLRIDNELLAEAQVRDRPIATFRLRHPLHFGAHDIHILEVPAPKKDIPHTTGFEHIEFVLNEPFEVFKRKAPKCHFEIQHYPFNPEMSLRLKHGSVKFHYASLEETIALELKPLWQKQIVLFDLDGTLIDSSAVIDTVNRKILKSLDASEEELRKTNQFPATFEKILKRFSITHVTEADYAHLWGQELLRQKHVLFDGVAEILEALKASGIPMAIWTARDLRSAEFALRDTGIDHYFGKIWAFDRDFTKPRREGFDFVSGGRPAEFVTFVGDSESDRNAAATVGCKFQLASDIFADAIRRKRFLDEVIT